MLMVYIGSVSEFSVLPSNSDNKVEDFEGHIKATSFLRFPPPHWYRKWVTAVS